MYDESVKDSYLGGEVQQQCLKVLNLHENLKNTLMLVFTLIFLGYISMSPDMNLESLKGVLIIGITVGIIYGLVAVEFL